MSTQSKWSNVSMRNRNVMTIQYVFKKKKKNFSTCAFYFFIFFDKPIHALILYELTLTLEKLNKGNEIKLTLWGSVVNQIEDNFFTENPGLLS